MMRVVVDGLASVTERIRLLVAYRTLLKYMVLKEIKVKSRGTYLGIGWTLMNPLFTIVVYAVVFQYIFRVGIPNFLAFFLVGFLMWLFFSRAVTAAATCIVDNEAVVKRSAFPLEVLPLAGVLYHLFHHVVALGIALPLMLTLWGARVSWSLLWVGAVLVAFVAFTLAVAMLLATVGVFFRDTRDILEVALPMLFWATPIFYSPDMAPEFLQFVVSANPVTSFLGAMRAALLEGHSPSGSEFTLMAFWLSLALLAGMWAFMHFRPRFAEES